MAVRMGRRTAPCYAAAAMDAKTVQKYWDGNAEAWVELSQAGYDKCRDLVNTPGFLACLPDVSGQRGLDLGCGETTNTRRVARRGATMRGIDISDGMLDGARRLERDEPLEIEVQRASMDALPFADGSFDFCVSFMAMMDCQNQPGALAEAYRVLRPGGFLQFSITHPVTSTPVRYWVRDEAGRKQALALAHYFDAQDGDIEEWIFGAAPGETTHGYEKFKIPRFHRTVSGWINEILAAGFVLEHVAEPQPDPELAAREPYVADMGLMPYSMVFRGRK